MSQILIPLDGSELANKALAIGDELAESSNSSVLLLTAGWGSTVEELETMLRAKCDQLKAASSYKVVPDTFPASAIVEELKTSDDLLVMSTHGRSGVGRALLGSVAEEVLNRTGMPVVLLGPHIEIQSFTGGTMAIAIDGTATSALVLAPAAKLAKQLALKVELITATTASGVPFGDADADSIANAVNAALAFLQQEGISAIAKSCSGGTADEAICDYVNAEGLAFLAMTSHSRSGMARTVLGSTTIHAVRNAKCPVIVVRPKV